MHRNEHGSVTISKERFDAMEKRISELEAALRSIVEMETDDEPVAYSWGLENFRRARALAVAAFRHKAGTPDSP